ncbi:MAG: hypothetical protein CME66_02375 [Halobacteriovoraceae bacterium]|jgi:hypothetical protein|nr:hypothetical protein [Halobacteriovoraceae bacterium]
MLNKALFVLFFMVFYSFSWAGNENYTKNNGIYNIGSVIRAYSIKSNVVFLGKISFGFSNTEYYLDLNKAPEGFVQDPVAKKILEEYKKFGVDEKFTREKIYKTFNLNNEDYVHVYSLDSGKVHSYKVGKLKFYVNEGGWSREGDNNKNFGGYFSPVGLILDEEVKENYFNNKKEAPSNQPVGIYTITDSPESPFVEQKLKQVDKKDFYETPEMKEKMNQKFFTVTGEVKSYEDKEIQIVRARAGFQRYSNKIFHNELIKVFYKNKEAFYIGDHLSGNGKLNRSFSYGTIYKNGATFFFTTRDGMHYCGDYFVIKPNKENYDFVIEKKALCIDQGC